MSVGETRKGGIRSTYRNERGEGECGLIGRVRGVGMKRSVRGKE